MVSKSYKQQKVIHNVYSKIFNNTKREYVKKPFKYWYGYIKDSAVNMKTFYINKNILNHKGWFRKDVQIINVDNTIKKGKEFISRSHVKTSALPAKLQNKDISQTSKSPEYTSGVNANRQFVSDEKNVDFETSKSISWDRNNAKAHIDKVIKTKPLIDSETGDIVEKIDTPDGLPDFEN